jgi:hypothetical protein
LFSNYFVFIPWSNIGDGAIYVYDILNNEINKSKNGEEYIPYVLKSINDNFAVFQGGGSSGDDSIYFYGNYYYKNNKIVVNKQCSYSFEAPKTSL